MSPGVSIFDHRRPRVSLTVAGRPATRAEIADALATARLYHNPRSRDPLERSALTDPAVIQRILDGALTP